MAYTGTATFSENPNKYATLLQVIADRIGSDKVVGRAKGRQSPLKSDRNVSGFPARSIPAVIRPSSIADVQSVVEIFRTSGSGVPLHPISTGRNWGLGSAHPTESEAILLDLGDLDKIREVNLEAGWAIIEPGVTQLTLSGALRSTNRMLNVTASSGHTSVLGNMLDRGVGLRRQRTADLLGLEIVLPNGELLKAGWWPTTSQAVNPYGLGPSLLHLFTQSSLGIVTAAAVSLLPRPERQVIIRTSFATQDTVLAVDELRNWHAQELVSGVIKIYDSVSTASYGSAPDRHLVLLSVSGAEEKVAALSEIILRRAAASGIFDAAQVLDARSISETDTVAKVVERLFAGDPSFNEEMLRAATGQDADNVDSDGNGWIFFLPLIPFAGKHVRQAYDLLAGIGKETGIIPGTTVNSLSSDVIDLVVSLRFPRNRENVEAAHRALDLAYERFQAAGYQPYRLDIEHRAITSPDSATARSVIKHIKQLVDPTGVICNGRYT